MEKKLNDDCLSVLPGKVKKKYVEPLLSGVIFASERGFATSVYCDTNSSEMTEDDNSYYINDGEWYF